jgi:hypothetical protein
MNQLIFDMLKKNPSERIAFEEIYQLPFIQYIS